MTQVAKKKMGTSAQFAYTYAIANPSAGTNSIVVSSSVSSTIYTTATSFTGVSQTTTFDAVATSSISGSSGNLSTTLSTTTGNCWTRCWSINDTNIFRSAVFINYKMHNTLLVNLNDVAYKNHTHIFLKEN